MCQCVLCEWYVHMYVCLYVVCVYICVSIVSVWGFYFQPLPHCFIKYFIPSNWVCPHCLSRISWLLSCFHSCAMVWKRYVLHGFLYWRLGPQLVVPFGEVTGTLRRRVHAGGHRSQETEPWQEAHHALGSFLCLPVHKASSLAPISLTSCPQQQRQMTALQPLRPRVMIIPSWNCFSQALSLCLWNLSVFKKTFHCVGCGVVHL